MKNITIYSTQIPLTIKELKSYLGQPFEKMIKFVADIDLMKIAIGGEMHADAELVLLEDGSSQESLWGANIYPEKDKNNWLEYTSLINIRPSLDNFGMEIESETIRQKIQDCIKQIINLNEEISSTPNSGKMGQVF